MTSILIIDDESQMREVLRRLLEREGYKIFEACNGSDGISEYKTNKPDIVITDLIMPYKEGIETIMELKQINPDIKIVAISGWGARNLRETNLHAANILGAECTVEKPIDKESLLECIRGIESGLKKFN